MNQLLKIRNGCWLASLILISTAALYFASAYFIPVEFLQFIDIRSPDPANSNIFMGFIFLGLGIFMLFPTGAFALQIFLINKGIMAPVDDTNNNH